MTEQQAAADVIAGDGATITLSDGSTAELRYSFAAIRQLERRFGSLSRMQRDINRASLGVPCDKHAETGHADLNCEDCEQQGAIFSILADALAPALLEHRVKHPESQQLVKLGSDQQLCDQLLDPSRLDEYSRAFGVAFAKATTQLGNLAAAGDAATDETSETTISSHGQSGITAQLSPSAALIGVSG